MYEKSLAKTPLGLAISSSWPTSTPTYPCSGLSVKSIISYWGMRSTRLVTIVGLNRTTLDLLNNIHPNKWNPYQWVKL